MGLDANAGAFEYAMAIRAAKIRFIGVGGLVIGGLWALISLIKPIKSAIASSFDALAKARQGVAVKPLRTEHDIPMTLVILGVIILAIPMTIIFNSILGGAGLPIDGIKYWSVLGFLTVAALVIGFICASIGGYMAGIVGSSANPISGITIGAILIMSLLVVIVLGSDIEFGQANKETLSLSAMVILVGAVVAVCAAFGCDNLQDLKSGQVLGATPWKQQVVLIVGAIAGALVVAPILELLFDAYGMGGVFPRPGMDPAHALAAPQATLMASVAQGIFEQTLDWSLVLIGVGIGICVLIIDSFILAKNHTAYRLSVLAISLGIYLPMDVVLPLVAGGLLSHFSQKMVKKQKAILSLEKYTLLKQKTERHGLLFSAGMIAGDALIGILLAIPFAAYQNTNVLAIVGPSFEQTATILGTIAFAAFCYYLYLLGSRSKLED
jgi:putative OPT family oligopeptide transporter